MHRLAHLISKRCAPLPAWGLAVALAIGATALRDGDSRPEAIHAQERSDAARAPLELTAPTRAGRFFDVVGRRAAVFGYEGKPLEAWVYPIKVLDDFQLAFQLEGYPLEIAAADIAVATSVRPEATTFVYSHAAFTVRQTVFVPIDEPGVVMLLDADTTLPLRVAVSFRPRLRLMWPAGLMTAYAEWDSKLHAYAFTEESKRYAAVIGSPDAGDLSVMPYQEEPRDVPVRFVTAPQAPGRAHADRSRL